MSIFEEATRALRSLGTPAPKAPMEPTLRAEHDAKRKRVQDLTAKIARLRSESMKADRAYEDDEENDEKERAREAARGELYEAERLLAAEHALPPGGRRELVKAKQTDRDYTLATRDEAIGLLNEQREKIKPTQAEKAALVGAFAELDRVLARVARDRATWYAIAERLHELEVHLGMRASHDRAAHAIASVDGDALRLLAVLYAATCEDPGNRRPRHPKSWVPARS